MGPEQFRTGGIFVKGHLVIAGGSIKGDVIYKRFIDLAGGVNSKIAIVPTGTKDALETLLDYTKVFENCGVIKDNIIGIKINPDINIDGEWKSCGDDFENFDFLKDVRGVWFTGGDQVRIIQGFLRSDGTETTILNQIKTILNTGGVIGGSSAGAAIMSEIMIAGGTSLGALCLPEYTDYVEYRKKPELEENGVLLIMKGLGFLNIGVIDQHFNKRNRLGRLIEVLFSEKINIGYGISEDTAIVYSREDGIVQPIGTGGVTIVNISAASKSKIGNYSKFVNLELSYLEEGDLYDVKADKFYLRERSGISDNEYNACKNYLSNILFMPDLDYDRVNSKLKVNEEEEVLYYSKEKKMNYVKNYQFTNEETGYEIRLYNKKGFKAEIINRNDTFVKAIMDILPVMLKKMI